MIYFWLCRQPLNNRGFTVQWTKKLRRTNETYAISVVSYTFAKSQNFYSRRTNLFTLFAI